MESESPTGSGELKRKADSEPAAAAPPPPDSPGADVAPEATSPVVDEPWRGVTPRRVDRLANGSLLVCSQGSVVAFRGCAIVNAANRGCLGGGGVDGAISSAGGDALADARHALPVLRRGVRCETGDAVVTCAGGTLRCDLVFHAVGPDYYDYETDAEADALLAGAYDAAMAHAARLHVRTLAFSLLSAAIYRAHRPLAVVLRIAVDALRRGAYDGLEEVHLVGFTPSELRTLVQVASEAAGEQEQGEAPEAPHAAPQAEQETPPPAPVDAPAADEAAPSAAS